MSSSPSDILSTETSQITNYLTDQLIEGLSADAELQLSLRQLRDTVWPLQENARLSSQAVRSGEIDLATQTLQKSEYQKIVDSVPEGKRAAFMEHVAQMGHLRQLASLVARDNFFQKNYENKGEFAPGTGSEFITNSDASIEKLLHSINGVTFNPVFTAHPTNNNALTSMKALGAIGRAISAYRANPEAGARGVVDAVAKYGEEPITPTTEEGKDHNLSAPEETQNMLHFMGEIYHQLPTTLNEYDTALQAKAEKLGESYHPLELRPQYKFDSWGSSGDKDGNRQVNATTTLDALLQHRAQALDFYLQDLNAVLADPSLIRQGEASLLLDWKDRLTKTQSTVQAIREEFDAERVLPANATMLPDAVFDRLSTQLADAYDVEKGGLRIESFIAQMESSYPHTQGEAQKRLLGLVRSARIFGENFGRLEFRETAEEFGRVVKLLVGDDYPFLSPSELAELKGETDADKAKRAASVDAFIGHVQSLGTDEAHALAEKLGAAKGDAKAFGKLLEPASLLLEEKRTATLTRCLQDPAKLAEMKARIGEITEKGAHKEYGDSPYPIAYQTFKRMGLARDFENSIVKQVLAECQAPSNVLEAKLLMEVVEKNGKKPVLGIVPLFEDPSLLATAHQTMGTIVANEVYKEHLEEFRRRHPEECAVEDGVDQASAKAGEPLPRKITQEVQFAHSDNGRRGGMPAARAYIYEAHENLQTLGKELGMSFREFHGGSASDPYRGGTRSYIGMIRDYQLQDNFKLTLQGGDLLNIFNYEGSIQRYLGGVLQYCAKQRLKPEQRKSTEVDKMARTALMGTLKDYTKRVFQNMGIGSLFAALADLFDLGAGNTGTRQQRKGVGFGHEETLEGDATFLDPNSIRTITFSELLQHNQINPTWVGALELSNNIRAVCKTELPKAIQELQDMEVPKDRDAGVFMTLKNRFLKQLGMQKETEFERTQRLLNPDSIAKMSTEDFYNSIRGINPGVVQYMYNRSPAFRDVMDRMAFGIATTNLSAVEFHHKDQLDENPQARAFLRTLKLEYVKAATIVYAAMTGQYPEAEKDQERAQSEDASKFTVPSDGLNLERVRNRILELPRLKHLKRDVEDNMALLDFVNSFKDQLRSEYKEQDAHILHKVTLEKQGESSTVRITVGESDVALTTNPQSFDALKDAIGAGVKGRHEIHFETSKGSASADHQEIGAQYLVRIGDAQTGPAFKVSHDAWVQLKEDVLSNGLPPKQRAKMDEDRKHVFRVVHCAADTATHVYYPTAGDRAYSQARFPKGLGIAA